MFFSGTRLDSLTYRKPTWEPASTASQQTQPRKGQTHRKPPAQPLKKTRHPPGQPTESSHENPAAQPHRKPNPERDRLTESPHVCSHNSASTASQKAPAPARTAIQKAHMITRQHSLIRSPTQKTTDPQKAHMQCCCRFWLEGDDHRRRCQSPRWKTVELSPKMFELRVVLGWAVCYARCGCPGCTREHP